MMETSLYNLSLRFRKLSRFSAWRILHMKQMIAEEFGWLGLQAQERLLTHDLNMASQFTSSLKINGLMDTTVKRSSSQMTQTQIVLGTTLKYGLTNGDAKERSKEEQSIYNTNISWSLPTSPLRSSSTELIRI